MATTTKERRNSKTLPGLNITNDAALIEKVQRIREYKTIERAAAEAERKRKVLEAELRAEMGDETQIVVRGQVIASLSSQRHAVVTDLKTLQSAFPEAFQACVSQKPYRFVTVASDATMDAILRAL